MSASSAAAPVVRTPNAGIRRKRRPPTLVVLASVAPASVHPAPAPTATATAAATLTSTATSTALAHATDSSDPGSDKLVRSQGVAAAVEGEDDCDDEQTLVSTSPLLSASLSPAPTTPPTLCMPAAAAAGSTSTAATGNTTKLAAGSGLRGAFYLRDFVDIELAARLTAAVNGYSGGELSRGITKVHGGPRLRIWPRSEIDGGGLPAAVTELELGLRAAGALPEAQRLLQVTANRYDGEPGSATIVPHKDGPGGRPGRARRDRHPRGRRHHAVLPPALLWICPRDRGARQRGCRRATRGIRFAAAPELPGALGRGIHRVGPRHCPEPRGRRQSLAGQL